MGMTYEQLMARGAKPANSAKPRLKYEDLMARGARPPAEDPGAAATYATKAGQGLTMGYIDEAGAGLAAAGMAIADIPARIRGEKATPWREALVSDYRSIRDNAQRQEDAGAKAHPVAAALGTGTGLALSLLAPLPKGGRGAKMTLGGAVKRGAAVGAAAGLGGSRADLTRGDVGGALLDTGIGAGIGGGGGALGYGLGRLLERPARSVGKWLEEKGINQGRRVLSGGSEPLADKKPVSSAAVREAIESKAIVPLGTTKGADERLQTLRSILGDEYNEIIEDMAKAGIRGPAVQPILDRLARRAAEVSKSSLSDAPRYMIREARKLASKPVENGAFGLAQAEGLKRSAQEAARREYERVGGTLELGEAKKEVARVLRESVEEAVERQSSKAPDLARAFVPVKQRVGRLIEAGNAAEKGAARAARRNGASLRDWMTAMAAIASGNPGLALPAAAAAAFARSRVPSTAAVGAYRAGQALQAPGQGPLLRALEKWLRTPEGQRYLREKAGQPPSRRTDQPRA